MRKNVNKDMALAANSTDLSRPEATSLEENNGTNAEVKAPSAKRLRNKFTEKIGYNHIAQKAGYAADHRKAAKGGNGFDKRHKLQFPKKSFRFLRRA